MPPQASQNAIPLNQLTEEVSPFPVVEPQPSLIPDISELDLPDLQPTEGENVASKLFSEVARLNEQQVGESAFRTQQEDAQNIAGLEKQQQELSSRLGAIKNEALAIPLQLQQEAIGRGITAGGLRPIETAALRNNAIQALSTASLLEASRGNLATAQSLVDRAVAAKYDPIREELNAKITNLQLLQQSPEFTLQQKNRARRAEQAEKVQARAIEAQEANEKAAYQLSVAALNRGAPLDIVKRMQESGSPVDALAIGGEFARDPETLLNIQAKIAEIENKNAATALSVANRQKIESEIQSVENVKSSAKGEILSNYSLVDDILASPDLGRIVGSAGLIPVRPGSSANKVKNQVNQLVGLLKLENRQKLKGQGQISDFEGKILADASTAFGTNLNEEDARFQLAQIRGAFANSAGLEAPVRIYLPDGSYTRVGSATREYIDDAIAKGFKVEYTQ